MNEGVSWEQVLSGGAAVESGLVFDSVYIRCRVTSDLRVEITIADRADPARRWIGIALGEGEAGILRQEIVTAERTIGERRRRKLYRREL
jgi:hypothetical protein